MAVVGHPKVGEMAAYLASHCLPEVGKFPCVPFLTEPGIDLHQRATQALFRRLALEPCFPCATAAPVVREAEIVEGRQRRPLAEGLPCLLFPKGKQARLLVGSVLKVEMAMFTPPVQRHSG